MKRKHKDTLTGWLTVLPALSTQIIFIYLPLCWAFYNSFFKWNMIRPMKFIGLRNYEKMFSSSEFWSSLWTTFLYVLGTVPPAIFIGLGLALLMNMDWLKLKGFFRTGFYIPVITAMAAAAVIWEWIFEPNYGILNWILSWFGVDGVGWLSDPNYSLVALMIVGVWKRVGYNMVLFLAGLQVIPKSLYEVADIDGASAFSKFKNITWPLLSPTTLFVVVLQFIASFRVFVSVSVMTRGGPLDSTRVITYYLYQQAFENMKFGYSSAVAVFMFVLMLVFTLIQFKVSKRRTFYT
ncbi:MAG TPA: sugar ABC transporter permease [Thermotogota bacterium]|nr:sugar ABC transporter permease [Thermotogota bacterium]HPJ88581.1 sugar ABC transporter permease [Thermotogota bacterium]